MTAKHRWFVTLIFAVLFTDNNSPLSLLYNIHCGPQKMWQFIFHCNFG